MEYLAPRTLGDVLRAISLSGGQARLMAGGTDLLARMNVTGRAPACIIDLKRLPELTCIEQRSDGSFVIGAAVCCADIVKHGALSQAWPGVTEAADLIGSVQIQNRATLGGNLCNASPAADTPPALIAARAVCRLLSPAGERTVRVEDIIVTPGRTCLRADEILVSIELPARPAFASDAYLRMTPRTEMDIAIVSAAANLVLDDQGLVKSCDVALGAAAPAPFLADLASSILTGSSLGEPVLKRFQHQITQACRPIDDKRATAEYRAAVAGVLAVRAVRLAQQRISERSLNTSAGQVAS